MSDSAEIPDVEKKPKKFSLRSRKFFLTYKSHLPKAPFLDFVSGIIDVRWYRIWHEKGNTETEYPHTHALFWAKRQPCFKDSRCFDFAFEDTEPIHPHIKPVNTDLHWKRLCNYNHDKQDKAGKIQPKDPDPLTNFEDEAPSQTTVQIKSILGKRTLSDLRMDGDTNGIYKERRYWAREIFFSRERGIKPREVHVRYGPSYSYKTQWVWDTYGRPDTVSVHNGFLVGYTGRPVVVFNDFTGEADMGRKMFLELTDKYPVSVSVKGGEVEWNPDVVCITSNTSPEGWYAKTDKKHSHFMSDSTCDAVRRRCTTIAHCIGVDENHSCTMHKGVYNIKTPRVLSSDSDDEPEEAPFFSMSD